MKTQVIINKLKSESQDYKWYPTTQEMLKIITLDINKEYHYCSCINILDIGAGNGNALSLIEQNLDNSNSMVMYAIEKSQILIEQMDKQIIVIGTDFHQQTLIDKKMDVIFCNPPYSEFVEWVVKIIKEAQASDLYMILPTRWKDNEAIKEIIEIRKSKYEILNTLSFEDSEYRKARVEVDIIKISLGRKQPKVDAFDLWFDEYFQFSAQKDSESEYNFIDRKKKEINELVIGKNIIERIVEVYNNDIQELMNNYKKLGELDASLLKELNVNVSSLKKALEQKVIGLKNIYWNIIFDRLEEITSRLTVESRKSMFNRLTKTTSIDFTVDNIYAILIWIIKHANNYYDTQLIDLYYRLSKTKNIINYKSNKNFINDNWRYARREDVKNYKLDYRIVYDGYKAIEYDWNGNVKGLSDSAKGLVSDIFTVANNLGFRQIEDPLNRKWVPGKTQSFMYFNLVTEKYDDFCDIKAYKNGNLHFKFNQKFMRKFNVEAARLNRWVKSPQETAEELQMSNNEVIQMYNSNCKFILKDIKLLT